MQNKNNDGSDEKTGRIKRSSPDITGFSKSYIERVLQTEPLRFLFPAFLQNYSCALA